jgi:hypothetical protein
MSEGTKNGILVAIVIVLLVVVVVLMYQKASDDSLALNTNPVCPTGMKISKVEVTGEIDTYDGSDIYALIVTPNDGCVQFCILEDTGYEGELSCKTLDIVVSKE